MNLRSFIAEKRHHAFRHKVDWNLAEEYAEKGLPAIERMIDRFERMCQEEKPVLLPEEKICFLRTVENLPDIFTQAEWEKLHKQHYIHETGYLSNLSPDFESCIRSGLNEKYENADSYGKRAITALIRLSDRYRAKAESEGKQDLAAVLERVPRYGATNFREALQFFRIIHFGLWLEGNYHNTVGRFDQYMYPYLKHDLDNGILDETTAYELLKDFFLSFNKDSDLYIGVQQGDNGQSMVLGGIDREGNSAFNLLSEWCLRASQELLLIDPKINLRVGKNTPIDIYELGSELTKCGLGFPQYSNDDVVIPALIHLGYAPEDASDYVVAACWEFIIPKVGADIANIAALSFPKIVNKVFNECLLQSETFEDFLSHIRNAIFEEVDAICNGIHNVWFVPSPFMNVLMGRDISKGGKYNNFGIHGSGLSTAADSLIAIQNLVYRDHAVSKRKYLDAVNSDFKENGELLATLRYEMPKMGCGSKEAEDLAIQLLSWFADALEGRHNDRGGIYRAGTGSAMYYLWHPREIGASPDGRRQGESFGANLSPSLFAKDAGPFSVINSFSKLPYGRAINGGPLTMEFQVKMFQDSNPNAIKALALLVKQFIDAGGHQLQLNTVHAETLKDAQKHPEQYRQLIVRIWGWSAYFVELDEEFQNHVISRQEYNV